MKDTSTTRKRPLEGIKVIELGQLLAGPFTGALLAYFGAEVIKVEPPGGDPIRGWREVQDGTSLWWHSLGRNKKSVCIDLKTEAGRELVRSLLTKADVLIENFRPGTMEEWQLGPEDLSELNPSLIYTRISGYGQDGPYATKPGYASVCEGFSGFRHLNGFPGQAPVRPNLSIGDSIAALHAALGICLALLEQKNHQHSIGQVVDVSLFESMFNLMEAVVPEYSGAGIVREPSGTTVTGIVPTNTYCCKDDIFVIIGGNGDSIYKRLMTAIEREDLARDPELMENHGRVRNEQRIDEAIADWCKARNSDEVITVLESARVPVGPILSIAEMFEHPHYRARGLFEQVEINGKPLEIPALLPKLCSTPGKTQWSGPALGEHTHSVLYDWLELGDEEIKHLSDKKILSNYESSSLEPQR